MVSCRPLARPWRAQSIIYGQGLPCGLLTQTHRHLMIAVCHIQGHASVFAVRLMNLGWQDIRTSTRRLVCGFALAPLAPGFIFLLLSIFLGKLGEGFWMFSLISMFTYAVAIFLGIPTYLLLKKIRANSLVSYFIAGGFLSAAPVIYLIVIPALDQWGRLYPSNYGQILFIFIVAAIVIITFWFIVRPDKA